jgi:hypothetical protein
VHLLVVLQKSRPELVLQLLLSQDQFDILSGVGDFALCWVDLGEEGQIDGVRALETVGVAREGEAGWLNVELEV